MEMLNYKNLENIICGDLMFRKIPEEICIQHDNNCFIIETSDEEHVCISAFRYYKPFIDQIPTKEDELANISSEKKVLKDQSGQIWFPPTKEAYYYSIIIDIEKSKIIEQYRSDFDLATNDLTDPSRVKIEFQRINALASDLVIYAQSENLEENGFNRTDPNHYIIFLLQETLIDLYKRLESRYNILLEIRIKSRKELRSELFNGLSAKSTNDYEKDRDKINNLFRPQFDIFYEEFRNDIFESADKDDFYNVFNNTITEETNIKISSKSIQKLYYLLHVLWDTKMSTIKVNYSGFTKKMFFSPILSNLNCEYGYFKNRNIISTNLKNADHKFKEKVDKKFK